MSISIWVNVASFKDRASQSIFDKVKINKNLHLYKLNKGITPPTHATQAAWDYVNR